MKFISIMGVLICGFLNLLFAQNKLTTSRTSGHYTYIYQLTDQEAYSIAFKSKSVINDAFLHSVVDSFYSDSQKIRKPLPYGNYLQVRAVQNKLLYSVVPVNNVKLNFVNNQTDFQFTVSDLKGKPVPGAKVKIGRNKTVKINAAINLYEVNTRSKEGVIIVDYNGVFNYFTYEREESANQPRRNNRKGRMADVNQYQFKETKPKYKGYMVFNKPMFKPLDTVKFKAYLVNAKGKPIHNKKLKAELTDGNNKIFFTLDNLLPYREGGYESSFVLADSLKLRLDDQCSLILKEEVKGKWVTVFRGSFRYEDYELKSVLFSVRTDRETHSLAKPAAIYLKATDENELAIPDGRVEVTIKSNYASKYYADKVYIQDTLWTTKLNLDPVGETKMVLPDSIFPKADFDFYMTFKFLNSNNESKFADKTLRYIYQENSIGATFVKDSLRFEYQVNGKSVPKKATILTSFENTDDLTTAVTLPVTLKIDYNASDYSVKTDDEEEVFTVEDFNPNLSVSTAQEKDSLRILTANEHLIPFWYTVFSKNKVIAKGYASRLDTLIKHSGEKTATVKLNYFWGETERNTESSSMYPANYLKVNLLAPQLIYPGQKVNMIVKVTDMDNKPVASTDVTALGYTSKFKNSTDVSLPDFSRVQYNLKRSPTIEREDLSQNGELKLNWDKWGKELGLDTIEYYKFVQTTSIYLSKEKSKDSETLVAPFVVKDGDILPAHLVYVDDLPVYFDQADQLQAYAFKVTPGVHKISLRTSNYQVSLDSVNFVQGEKTILSISGDPDNKSAVVSTAKPELDQSEADLLNNYMISITNNFKEEKTTVKTDNSIYLINKIPVDYRRKDLIIGPIKENYLTLNSGATNQTFLKEPGYVYTVLPGLLKQKSYFTKYNFDPLLNFLAGANTDYKQYPYEEEEIDSIWNDYLDLRSRTTNLFYTGYRYNESDGKIQMDLDTSISNHMPYLKNILIYKYNEFDFLQIYPGNSGYFNSLEPDVYRILYLFKDNRYFVADSVKIKGGGLNYFKWKTVKIMAADEVSRSIDRKIKGVITGRASDNASATQMEILEQSNTPSKTKALLKYTMSGLIVYKTDGMPASGVYIKVVGLPSGVTSKIDGSFILMVPAKGKVSVSMIGYETLTLKIVKGNAGKIELVEQNAFLEEVVVVGYGAVKKKDLTGSTTTINSMLEGRLAGVSVGGGAPGSSLNIRIRGISSLPPGKKPLILVNGLNYNGDISGIDPGDILEMVVIKEADATAIYGALGANGVIMIKTRNKVALATTNTDTGGQQQTMRTDFSDYAFWQPKLMTDETGTARFTVKFPDDITNWNTKVIAMNGNKQVGSYQTNIKSFKTLSANFVAPLFALKGDTINVIGKLLNYSSQDESVLRTFKYNGTDLLNSSVKFKNSKIDTVSIVAQASNSGNATDSLNFEYTLKQDNGYFDGEIRKIPLLVTGVLETKGYFNALTQDTSINHNFTPEYGKVTVRAESSVFPVLLEEFDRISNYEYLCNEQLASKLKALLLEKEVRIFLGETFKKEKRIKELLKLLQNNKRSDETWGWWQNSKEELWISLHVVEAMLLAEKQGYQIQLDKVKLKARLLNQLVSRQDYDQIHALKTLLLLNDKQYVKDLITSLEQNDNGVVTKTRAEKSMYEKLSLLRLKQQAGMAVDLKWLSKQQKETMFGNIYWGETVNRFWDNSIQNTLLAYQLLKADGNHQAELSKIQQYFFEQKMDGQWHNTYESSLILEAIVPDLLKGGKKPQPAVLMVNNENITKFPYQKIIDAGNLTLKKSGDAPVYFTAFQQFLNPNPVKVSKDFTVRTWFDQKGSPVKILKAGTTTVLNVEVEVRADADYVMIEVPIPAGCSYENKLSSFFGVETHREYFKNKTSIFCTKLKQGKYTFSINLMPRYSGRYTLNPAKAEMMYFPVFFGREQLKRIAIN
jgi:TonB-dependent SusC/RagA subfamily outer membrane receptor